MLDECVDPYYQIVRGLALPTGAQIRAFARHIATERSWYKKLPLRGPGEPFFLFLDPTVHLVRIEREDGGNVAREVVRHQAGGLHRSLRVNIQPGDINPSLDGSALSCSFSRTSTAEYRQRYGHWRYWNRGRGDEPFAQAISRAVASIRIHDIGLDPFPVPAHLLELGAVFLRGTVSGFLGSTETEFQELQEIYDVPAAEEDQALQLIALEAAMHAVVDHIYS